jgi:hypothetical protein
MSLKLVTFNTGIAEARKMRVTSGPFPHFMLIDEYEASLLSLYFDDFETIFEQQKKPGAFTYPQIPQKAP